MAELSSNLAGGGHHDRRLWAHPDPHQGALLVDESSMCRGGAGSAVWGMGVGLQPSEGRVRLEPRDTPGNGGWKGGGPRIGVKKG